MITQCLVSFLLFVNADVHSVKIECPGITCRSRFAESLNAHIVNEISWIHSVEISYPEEGRQASLQNADNAVWGDTARLVFVIEQDHNARELAKMLVDSGYYQTKNWTLIERVPFSEID